MNPPGNTTRPATTTGKCLLAFLWLTVAASSGAAPGEVDPSFAPLLSGGVSAVTLQVDGKILIGGAFTNINSTDCPRIARLNRDGSLDTSFNPGTGADAGVSSLAVQSDGKVLIGGSFTNVNGTMRRGIARLNADGTLDTSFDPGSGVADFRSYRVSALAVQADGKIVIGGMFRSVNGTNRDDIARLNADGGLESTVFVLGASASAVRSIIVQPDGKVVVGGSFGSDTNMNIARFNADGGRDEIFASAGVSPDVASMAMQTDGKLLIGGGMVDAFNGVRYPQIGRLTPTGTMDTSFNPGSGASGGEVLSIAAQPDGKVVIVGSFTVVNGGSHARIARLHADGSIDDNFGASLGGPCDFFCPWASAVAVQADGKVLVGGTFTTVNGSARKYLVRLFGDDLPQFTSVVCLSDGRVQLAGRAALNARLRLDASGNLLDWTAMDEFTNAPGTFILSDEISSNSLGRFYRLVWLP